MSLYGGDGVRRSPAYPSGVNRLRGVRGLVALGFLFAAGALSGGCFGGRGRQPDVEDTRELVGTTEGGTLMEGASDRVAATAPSQSIAANEPRPADADDALRARTSGGLTKEQIRRAIRAGINGFRRCAEEGRGRTSLPIDRVDVRFWILSPGTVGRSEIVGSGSGDQLTDACILEVVQRLVFQAHEGPKEVMVTFPFIFDFVE